MPYPRQQPSPMMFPGVYSPGQMAFTNNPELSQLVAMFSGPLLNKMAGPGNFAPHLMPTQQIVDQFALRNYQAQTQQATMNIAHDNTDNVAERLLGMRSIATKEAPTELNREQAANMAAIINNPFMKAALGQFIGADNMESLLHGQKGDISSLHATLGRINYFRDDPLGHGRMDANALTSYTRAMHANLYEAQGNVEQLSADARSADQHTRDTSRRRLKSAALPEVMRRRMSDAEIDASTQIVEDSEVEQRLMRMEETPKRVDELYKKYVQGGKETDTAKQAQAITKIENAITASGVLSERETTIRGLEQKAELMPVNEMRGFKAGQVGQIADHMFQRGMMPKGLGRMSQEDRLRMVNDNVNVTPLDEENESRIAREMAERDLLRSNNNSEQARKFRGASLREREQMIDTVESSYRDTLNDTRKEIEKTATGAAGSKDISEVEKMAGFDALASNTDAKRSVEAIKKYTGAVAAVRDIFGDNGNQNAPMPALLAALEGLTGGAVGSMRPQQIESTLRQMQSLAKEAGIGFEQMAAISTQIDSQAQAIGLTPADAMRLKPAAFAAAKVMQDTGAFSNPIYGQLDKPTSIARTTELITAGAGSRNARSMAALAAVYKADPSRFGADSEITRAMEAYNNNEGDGSYTFTDKDGNKVTKNLRDLVGQLGGDAVARGILQNSGASAAEFEAQINNPAIMQHSNPLFGFLTQRADLVQDMRFGYMQTALAADLSETAAFENVGLTAQQKELALGVTSQAMTEMALDTADLPFEEQIKAIQKQTQDRLETDFIAKGMPEAQAKQLAAQVSSEITSPEKINKYVGGAASVAGIKTGQTLSQLSQDYKEGRGQEIAAETTRAADIADRRSAAGISYESDALARGSDYFQQITRAGEAFNIDEFVRAIGRPVSERQFFDSFMSDMESTDMLIDMRRATTFSRSEVEQAAKTAKTAAEAAGDDETKKQAAYDDLRRMGGLAADTKIVTDAEAEALQQKHVESLTDSELASFYSKYAKGGAATTEEYVQQNKQLVLGELRGNAKFKKETLDAALAKEKSVSVAQAVDSASRNIGTAKRGTMETTYQDTAGRDYTHKIALDELYADVEKIDRARLEGSDDAVRSGVYATFHALGVEFEDTGDVTAENHMTAILDAVKDKTGTMEERQGRLDTALKDHLPANLPPELAKKSRAIFRDIQRGAVKGLGRVLNVTQTPDKEWAQMSAAEKSDIIRQIESINPEQAQQLREQEGLSPAAAQTPPAAAAPAGTTVPPAQQEKPLLSRIYDAFFPASPSAPAAAAAATPSSPAAAAAANDAEQVRRGTGESAPATPPAQPGQTPPPAAAASSPTVESLDQLSTEMITQTTLGGAMAAGDVESANRLAGVAAFDSGLLNSIREIKKTEGDTVAQEVEFEKLATSIAGAAEAGIIQLPTDENGDPIQDDEALVKFAEDYLGKKYTAAGKKDAVQKANDAELARTTGAEGVSSNNVKPGDIPQLTKPGKKEKPSSTWFDTASAVAGQVSEALGFGSAQQPDAALAQSMPRGAETPAMQQVNRVQQLPASILNQSEAEAYKTGRAATGGDSGGGRVELNGTLAITGLQEAIISATGSRVMDTPDGSPVVIDPPTTPKTAPAQRK